jgi:hypothetical protein
MVVYIPIYHCIMKLEYIFTLQQLCHNAVIVKNDYKRQDLMVLYRWNFVDVKRQPWGENPLRCTT